MIAEIAGSGRGVDGFAMGHSDERATLTQSGKARFADDLSRTVRKIKIMRKLMAQADDAFWKRNA
jgi:hypothetical protein